MYICTDVPGTDHRIATISGNPDACARAQRMVEEIVDEVKYSIHFWYKI